MFSFEPVASSNSELVKDLRLSLLNRFSLVGLLVLLPFAIHHFYVGEPAWGTTTAVAILLCVGNVLASACRRGPLLPVWAQFLLILAALAIGLRRYPEEAVFWSYVVPVTYRGVCREKTARWLDLVYLLVLIPFGFAGLTFEVAIRYAVTLCLVCFLLDLLSDAVMSQLRELSEQAVTDPLTGVGNRRRLQQLFREFKSHPEPRPPACLVALDVDQLKEFNDRNGHQAGDSLLVRIAETLQKTLPENATLCRTGGDEFTVLLNDTTESFGCVVAEGLRERIASEPGMQSPSVTISLGVAGWQPGQSLSVWQQSADERLYTAKRGGGNRICVGNAEPDERREGAAESANPVEQS